MIDHANPFAPPGLPHGFALRSAEPGDAVAVHALVVNHHAATGASEDPALVEIVADLEHPDIDLGRDTWLVHDGSGDLVGYGIAYCDRPGRTFFDVYLARSLTREDSLAIGRDLAARGATRGIEDARERGLDETLLESGMLRDDVVLPEVLAAFGFAPARRWWRMLAEREVIVAARPVEPEGVRIAKVDGDDDAVLAVAHDVELDTFAAHYGYVPVDLDTFRREQRSSAGFDPTAWWFASDTATGEVVGLLIGNESRLDSNGGFLDTLGVRAAHRGRGIASALLRTGFAEYAGRGRSTVALEVDASNETGAVALYERVGMRATEVVVTWERPVPLT